MNYDLIIIGGGPAGYEAGLICSDFLNRVLIIEENKIGGTCLNKGCIPTKALLSLSEKEIDIAKAQKEKDKRVKKLRIGLEAHIKSKKIEIIYGKASLVGRRSIAVNGNRYNAENIIIATGAYPKMLNVDISSKKIITSDEALDLDTKPESIAIIGGGVIGLEFATYFNNLGVKINIIEYEKYVLPMAEHEISISVEKQLKKDKINVLTSTKVQGINEKGVICKKDNKEMIVNAKVVMMATGRGACLSCIKLCDGSEIKTNNGFIKVDENMQTNIKGIYAIGDITGKSMLAHSAYMQAEIAANSIKNGTNKSMNYDLIPSCVFINPEVAWVGFNEKNAIEKGYDVICAKSDLISNGRAVAIDEKGIIKVVAEKRTGKLLGVHIHSKYASEIISQALIAMKFNAVVSDFEDMVFPHPTISEAFKESVLKLKYKR